MNRVKNILSIVLLVIMAIAVAVFFSSRWDDIRAMRIVSPFGLALVAIAFAAGIFVRGTFVRSVLRAFDVDLQQREAFALSAVGTLFNSVLPIRTGMGVRGAYLYRYHKLPVSQYLSTMTAFASLSLLVASLAGLASFGMFTDLHDMRVRALLAVMLLLAVTTSWMIFWAPRFPSLPGQITQFLERIGRGWDTIREHPTALRSAATVSAFLPIVGMIGFYFGFRAFGVPITWSGALMIAVSYSLAGVIAITPGGLGIQELIGIFCGDILGMDIVQTLSILLAIRFLRVATVCVVGFPSMFFLRIE